MRFEPYKDETEDEEGIVEGVVRLLLLDVRLDRLVVDGVVKLPGLLIMQYLFFWNWKRVIDPNSRSVVLTGLMVMLALAGTVIFLILSESA